MLVDWKGKKVKRIHQFYFVREVWASGEMPTYSTQDWFVFEVEIQEFQMDLESSVFRVQLVEEVEVFMVVWNFLEEWELGISCTQGWRTKGQGFQLILEESEREYRLIRNGRLNRYVCSEEIPTWFWLLRDEHCLAERVTFEWPNRQGGDLWSGVVLCHWALAIGKDSGLWALIWWRRRSETWCFT